MWIKVYCTSKCWTIIILKKKKGLGGDSVDSLWNKCWHYYFKWLNEKKILSNLGDYYFPQIEKKVKPHDTMNTSFWVKQVSKINLKS